MEAFQNVSGAQILGSISQFKQSSLGYIKLMEERELNGKKLYVD